MTTKPIHPAPLFALLLAFLFLVPAHADSVVAEEFMPDPQVVGKGRMKVMLWNVFDATLYAENGQYDADKPFALSLAYLRKLKGKKIVEKTLSEIRSQGPLDSETGKRWSTALDKIIPDVDDKTIITGVRDARANTLFYQNGAFIGQIDDPAFTEAFFGIWLGNKSSKPELTRKLLGQTDS